MLTDLLGKVHQGQAQGETTKITKTEEKYKTSFNGLFWQQIYFKIKLGVNYEKDAKRI